jgi:hypothetical protein
LGGGSGELIVAAVAVAMLYTTIGVLACRDMWGGRKARRGLDGGDALVRVRGGRSVVVVELGEEDDVDEAKVAREVLLELQLYINVGNHVIGSVRTSGRRGERGRTQPADSRSVRMQPRKLVASPHIQLMRKGRASPSHDFNR